MEKTMDKIVALAKARGFVYPGSEIYGGLANTWDYGNLGVELKNNVKKAWWQKFIMENPYNVGVDCAILMNPQTWVASGHLGGFSDPLMDCKECHERFRADKIIEDYAAEHQMELDGSIDGWSQEKMKDFIKVQKINQKAQILVNKKFITRIIEGKQDSCIVFKRNKINDKLIVKEDIEYFREQLETFIPVMIEGKKCLVNVDNIIAIYDTRKGAFLQTQLNWLNSFNVITGYQVQEPIETLLLKINLHEKSNPKE